MNTGMRRVRRNIVSRPESREVETESWGFRRTNARQPRLRAPVNAGSLNQRLANLEEEVAEMNLALAKQASSINSLNNRMGRLESGGMGCGPCGGPGAFFGPPSLPYDPSCITAAGPYGSENINTSGCGQPIPTEPYIPGPYTYQYGLTGYPAQGCAPGGWGGPGGCAPGGWGPAGCAPGGWGGPGGCPPGGWGQGCPPGGWGQGGCPPGGWGQGGCPPGGWGPGGCPPGGWGPGAWGPGGCGQGNADGQCDREDGSCSRSDGCCKKKDH